jgi:ABC-type transport system involved in multi-copper enzyme maturation permease subunit
MTFLPIVERELRVAARLTSTYKRRAVAAAIVALVATIMLFVGILPGMASQVGRAMFGALSYMMLVFCLLEGVRKTADCVSEERREGTLGLLFLTDLKGYDVILGKLAATSLPSLYGLLSMLPILGLSLLLGGVTQGEFWRRSLALVDILFFSLAAGLWVSARSRVERRAVTATLCVLLASLGVGLLPRNPISSFSPAYAFFNAPELSYRMHTGWYWESLLMGQVLSWGLLGWAAFAVNRVGEEVTVARRRSVGEGRRRAENRAEMLGINPAYWLAWRTVGEQSFPLLWISVLTASGFWLLFAFIAGPRGFARWWMFPFLVNYPLKMWVARQACRYPAEARANNSLEMLLSTPLPVESILSGQVMALRRLFLHPVVTLLACELIGVVALGGFGHNRFADVAGMVIIVGLVGGFFLGMFLLDLLAITWVGMWFGLSSKNETLAVFKTILYVLVIPLAFGLFYCFGLPFLLVWPLVCFLVAGDKLRSRFRLLAAQRFAPAQESSGWWPFQRSASPRVPPRIAVPIPSPGGTREGQVIGQ